MGRQDLNLTSKVLLALFIWNAKYLKAVYIRLSEQTSQALIRIRLPNSDGLMFVPWASPAQIKRSDLLHLLRGTC